MELKKEIYRNIMDKCALCYLAPCSTSCGKIDLEKILHSVWFDNEYNARRLLPSENPCKKCKDKKCISSCKKSVDIPMIIEKLYQKEKLEINENDYKLLETDICGKKLENPFLLSSSVVGSNYEMCAKALETGWAGVCYKTITTIDIHETSPRFATVRDEVTGAINGFKNIEQLSIHTIEEDLEIFRKLKKNFPNKYLLVSIMEKDESEWKKLASLAQEAGADGIELNFSCPNMVDDEAGDAIGQNPESVKKFTKAAKSGCTIPVIAKLTPNVARMKEAAEAAIEAGADGLSAINTILSIIDVNDKHKKFAPGGYSGNAVKPIALRFVAELCKNEKTNKVHISAMGGVETWRDSLGFFLLGAKSIQITTAVMQYGYSIIDDLKTGLILYLKSKNKNLKQIISSAINDCVETQNMERDITILPKFNKEKCIGCLRCYVSCQDGGHQAITFDEKTRTPILNGKKCVGCHLCISVCPNMAITSTDVCIKQKTLK